MATVYSLKRKCFNVTPGMELAVYQDRNPNRPSLPVLYQPHGSGSGTAAVPYAYGGNSHRRASQGVTLSPYGQYYGGGSSAAPAPYSGGNPQVIPQQSSQPGQLSNGGSGSSRSILSSLFNRGKNVGRRLGGGKLKIGSTLGKIGLGVGGAALGAGLLAKGIVNWGRRQDYHDF